MILQTRRLVLRPPLAGDLDGWAAVMGDAAAMRYLGGVQPRPVAWRSLAATAGSWSLQGFGLFSVLLRDGGAWIGRVGPLHPEGWPVTEIGWGLLPAFQRQGYAVEAAEAAARFAFEALGWSEIGHVIDPDNAASIAVARALGSRRRGPTRLPEPYADAPVDLWGQDRAQWLARHAVPAAATEGDVTITVSAELDDADQATLECGLDRYNASRVGPEGSRPVWAACRDVNGRLVAGARCMVLWRWLLLDWLWVEEARRGQGLGSLVLQRAEEAGAAAGCTEAMLNTFSFQAPGFYRRHGYAVFGELTDMPEGETRYWMSKRIGAAAHRIRPGTVTEDE